MCNVSVKNSACKITIKFIFPAHFFPPFFSDVLAFEYDRPPVCAEDLFADRVGKVSSITQTYDRSHQTHQTKKSTEIIFDEHDLAIHGTSYCKHGASDFNFSIGELCN
jgi:hypothetical protein